jgi:membrane-bound serine protease (ClpP class)
VLFILAVVLFVTVPAPWNAVLFGVLLVLGVFEVGYWWRKVKDRRVQTGAETLAGRDAKVVADCRPVGQVSLDGALWRARCDGGADAGETVVVTARDGLMLVVERQA